MIIPKLDIFKYSSIIDSKKLNKHEQDLVSELIELFGTLNTLDIKIEEANYLTSIENHYSDRAITMLYQEMQKNKPSAYISAYPTDLTLIDNAIVDSCSNTLLMAPLKKESKLCIIDPVYNTKLISETLIFEINDDAPQYISVKDNNVNNCLSADKPWVREITTSNSVNEVYCTLNVYLPYDICANDIVNEIKFNLFPMDSAEVLSMQYSNGYDVSYLSNLDELLNHKGCVTNEFEIGLNKNTNNITIETKDKAIKILSITIKQSIYKQLNGTRKFYLGLSNFEVNKNYYPSSMEFSHDVNIVEETSIDKIEIEHNSPYNNPVNISVFEIVDGVEVPMYPKFAQFSTKNKKIRFKFKLEHTDVAPNIRKIKFYLRKM